MKMGTRVKSEAGHIFGLLTEILVEWYLLAGTSVDAFREKKGEDDCSNEKEIPITDCV